MYDVNGFNNNYDELKTYYPIFYLDIFEMNELLKTYGSLLDDLVNAIDLTINNNFVLTADEPTITKFERFLMLKINRNKSLDSRKRLILALLSNYGKLSASKIKEIIFTLCGANSDIVFEDSLLKIDIHRENILSINFSDIFEILSRKIPAHLGFIAKGKEEIDSSLFLLNSFTRIKHEEISVNDEVFNNIFIGNSVNQFKQEEIL